MSLTNYQSTLHKSQKSTVISKLYYGEVNVSNPLVTEVTEVIP